MEKSAAAGVVRSNLTQAPFAKGQQCRLGKGKEKGRCHKKQQHPEFSNPLHGWGEHARTRRSWRGISGWPASVKDHVASEESGHIEVFAGVQGRFTFVKFALAHRH